MTGRHYISLADGKVIACPRRERWERHTKKKQLVEENAQHPRKFLASCNMRTVPVANLSMSASRYEAVAINQASSPIKLQIIPRRHVYQVSWSATKRHWQDIARQSRSHLSPSWWVDHRPWQTLAGGTVFVWAQSLWFTIHHDSSFLPFHLRVPLHAHHITVTLHLSVPVQKIGSYPTLHGEEMTSIDQLINHEILGYHGHPWPTRFSNHPATRRSGPDPLLAVHLATKHRAAKAAQSTAHLSPAPTFSLLGHLKKENNLCVYYIYSKFVHSSSHFSILSSTYWWY